MIGIDLDMKQVKQNLLQSSFQITVLFFVIVVTMSPLTTVSSVDEMVLALVAGTTVSVIIYVLLFLLLTI